MTLCENTLNCDMLNSDLSRIVNVNKDLTSTCCKINDSIDHINNCLNQTGLQRYKPRLNEIIDRINKKNTDINGYFLDLLKHYYAVELFSFYMNKIKTARLEDALQTQTDATVTGPTGFTSPPVFETETRFMSGESDTYQGPTVNTVKSFSRNFKKAQFKDHFNFARQFK